MFWCRSFGGVLLCVRSLYFWFGLVCCVAAFWEIAARSVGSLFSLYFVYLCVLFISRFGFKSGICLLIAPVPVHCFSVAFIYT